MAASRRAGERPLTSLGIGLAELETFLTVASTASFSAAALRLGLSQPAVTARVQKLEQVLGTRLLHRTTRSVEVTEAGRRLAAAAAEAMHGLRAIVSGLLEESGKARRRVSVAATPMVAATLLPGIVQAWRAVHPEVPVTIRDLRHAATLESLDRGESDLAILALDRAPTRFRFQLLAREEMVALVPEGHALARAASIPLEELSRHAAIIIEHHAPILAQIEAACEARGLRLAQAMTVANTSTVLGMLAAGAGIAILPRIIPVNQVPPRHWLAIEGVSLHRTYGVLTPRGRELSSAARGFSDFLRRNWTAMTHGAPSPAGERKPAATPAR